MARKQGGMRRTMRGQRRKRREPWRIGRRKRSGGRGREPRSPSSSSRLPRVLLCWFFSHMSTIRGIVTCPPFIATVPRGLKCHPVVPAFVNSSCDPLTGLIGFPCCGGSACVWIASAWIGVYVHIRILLPSSFSRYFCVLPSSSLDTSTLYLHAIPSKSSVPELLLGVCSLPLGCRSLRGRRFVWRDVAAASIHDSRNRWDSCVFDVLAMITQRKMKAHFSWEKIQKLRTIVAGRKLEVEDRSFSHR